jgi:hypothetical protein
MPIFSNNDDDQTFKSGAGFHFSGTKLAKLGASEYTLMGLACDMSGSVFRFAKEIEDCLIATIESCQKSPRADNLLARLVTFNTTVEEQHGFRPLADCHLAKYKGIIQPGGCTVLCDASTSLISSMAAYGKQLIKNDFQANGIVVIITDGIDEGSTLTADAVKKAIEEARMSESLESIVTILIGINVTNQMVSNYLKHFKDAAGIDQYVEAKDATPSTLAKVAGFISKSVSSQSQSLGTGGASQPITF